MLSESASPTSAARNSRSSALNKVELFQQFAAVCFVLALAGLAAYWFKRGAPRGILIPGVRGANVKRLEVVQRLPLTAQHYLCLVRLDGSEWLICVYPNGATVLGGTGSKTLPGASQDRKEVSQ